MKYLLLVYADKPDTNDAVFQSDTELLSEGGYLLSALYLQTAAASSAMLLCSGELALADVGPLDIMQNQLAALYVINSCDLNEAIRVASRMPQAQHGLVEIRSLLDFDGITG